MPPSRAASQQTQPTKQTTTTTRSRDPPCYKAEQPINRPNQPTKQKRSIFHSFGRSAFWLAGWVDGLGLCRLVGLISWQSGISWLAGSPSLLVLAGWLASWVSWLVGLWWLIGSPGLLVSSAGLAESFWLLGLFVGWASWPLGWYMFSLPRTGGLIMTTSTSTFPSLTVWLFESLGPLVSFGWLAGPIGLSLSELVV